MLKKKLGEVFMLHLFLKLIYAGRSGGLYLAVFVSAWAGW